MSVAEAVEFQQPLDPAGEQYKAMLKRASNALKKQGEVQKYDPEMLVRRGNYLVIITPEIAAELLERNRNNRKPKRRAIAQYGRDMLAGNWNPDASDIKVDRNGDLSDGQNRCMASVEFGVPFPTLLRTGTDPDARDHVDQGVRRTGGDVFRMEGLADPNNIAAAINMRERYERTIRDYGGRQTVNPRRVPMTHAELKEYLENHPQVERMVPLGTTMQREGPGVPRSVFIAALSMFAESSEKMAREFAEKFISGESSGTGDPLLALSRYLARAKSPTELRTKSRNRNQQHLAAVVLAWNAWVQSEKLEKLTVRDGDKLESPV
jgi:hypothetical protein